MFNRARIVAGSVAAGLLLTGGVAVGGVVQPPTLAGAARLDPASPGQVMQVQPQPLPKPGRADRGRRGENLTPEQRQQRKEQYRNRLAANLGVTPERLTQAFRQAHVDLINQAVTEGRLTREQADRKILRINSGQPGRGPRQ